MHFTKMEGLGNDYIYLNCMERLPSQLDKLAVRLSDRHFGVGADGLICICPGLTGDFTMRMYNADGSRGAMCGNGIRCLGKYVYDKEMTRKTCLTIDTDAGPRELEMEVLNGRVERVTVNMGRANVLPEVELVWEDGCVSAIPVSVGNPHAVVFCSNLETVDLEQIGPILEHHPDLYARSNVEFVQAAEGGRLDVRVWERGSGITLACGTGACAAFAAARSRGVCGQTAQVYLPGGMLDVEQRGENLFLAGPARQVFEGEWNDFG